MKTLCHSLAGSIRYDRNRLSAFLSIVFLLFTVLPAGAQVNAYARVSSISGTTLGLANVNTSFGTFTNGSQVIIMQMQDNVIGANTGNNPSFGGLAAIANVGFYEVATISTLSPSTGTPTSAVLTKALTKTYTIGANSRVQMISFKILGATNFTLTTAITALPWDGNVGGVVAVQVGGTLTLKNSITANAQGFRGGAVSANYELSCEPSVYATTSSNYADKGEGLYLSTNTAYTYGRARIINGGGGGSDDNAGGGGGANFTGGGEGGEGVGCTVATASGGLGGVSLLGYSLATRIYMGGGGGGGQQDDGAATAGGNGGGIVLVRANAITTASGCTGGTVSIGAGGGTAAAAGGDGAGGGGGGGTVVLQVSTVSAVAACPLTVQANGGNGGDVNSVDVHGGGGGGGQGAVYSSVSLAVAHVTATTTNGVGGLNSNAPGATRADNGTGTSNSGVVAGTMAALPVIVTSFTAVIKDKDIQLGWSTTGQYQNMLFNVQRSLDGVAFTSISTSTATNTDMTTRNYYFTDRNAAPGKRYYRLEMIEPQGGYDYSAVIPVSLAGLPAVLLAYPNPARGHFVIETGDATGKTYSLVVSDLGGQPVYQHTYNPVSNVIGVTLDKTLSPGTYIIRLTGNNTTQFGKIMIL